MPSIGGKVNPRGSSMTNENPMHTGMTPTQDFLSRTDSTASDIRMERKDSDMIDYGQQMDDIMMEREDSFMNVTADQGEIELGSYALPKKPRSFHNNDLRAYTKLPAPPSRTDYSAHGHMASKSLKSRIGYTVALLKCERADERCAPSPVRPVFSRQTG